MTRNASRATAGRQATGAASSSIEHISRCDRPTAWPSK